MLAFNEVVETWYVTPPFAPTSPENEARVGALVKVWVPAQVLFVVVPKAREKVPEVSMTGYDAPRLPSVMKPESLVSWLVASLFHCITEPLVVRTVEEAPSVERPVPPPPMPRSPERVLVKVRFWPALVIVVEAVSPFQAADEVAMVTAPVMI